MGKGLKKLISKKLKFSDNEKFVFNSINAPITKEHVSFNPYLHYRKQQNGFSTNLMIKKF